MYSSYYKPSDGRESTVLTDHEALHRDEAVHKSMQSDETQLRPLDLETIMSSKAAVKFWYLHRPKTMEFVHTKATKIQSLGRAFAVRRLKERYGMEYVVELAKEHTEKKEAEKLNDLSDEERIQKEKEDAEYEARVEESKRLRREQIERERKEEEELRARLAAEAAAKEEEDRLRKEAEELEQQRQEEERLRLEAEEKKRKEEEEEEALRLAAIEKQRQEEEEEERKRLEEEERQREEEAEKERLRLEEEERERKEEEERLRQEEEERQREAEAIERKRRAEEEQRRLEQEEQERLEREKEERRQREKEERRRRELEAIKAEKYEQSLSKNVPVIVRRHGAGRVEYYDKERETYMVKLEKEMGGLSIEVRPDDINLDDDRILSPRTVVDTPFGVGEVVGLDPHVGCYAVKTELGGTDGEENMAFVQIPQVQVHQEEEEEKAIVEDPQRPIPDEIKLVAARIVDSRVVHRTGKKFIQYKLEVQTSNYGTVYCWKRYSTFRSLCDRLHKESGVRRRDIPELPHRQILGNFSQSVVGDRSEKLNAFLRSAVQADHLQWGIRVDDKIAVYKRRVKKPSSGGIFSRRR